MEGKTVYFEKRGKANTAAVFHLARQRAEELGIRRLVVASTHGYAALKAAEVFQGSGVQIIAVSISAAFDSEGWTMSAAERKKLEKKGVRVLTSLHGLADGVAEGFYGAVTPGTVAAETLRWFSQGTKVAVEVAIMAAEAGLVKAGEEIIAVGGTNEGSDTALVLRPAYAHLAKELKVCEILCKPRLA